MKKHFFPKIIGGSPPSPPGSVVPGMFTEAHTLLSEDTWEKGPNIKNPYRELISSQFQKKETVSNPCSRTYIEKTEWRQPKL